MASKEPDNPADHTFNLEAEVQRWCGRLQADPADAAGVSYGEELADHLHCEIDRLRKNGMDPATAFLRATESMGASKVLQAELIRGSGQQYSSGQLLGFAASCLLILLVAVVAVVVLGPKPYVEHMLAAVYLLWVPLFYWSARGRAVIGAEGRMLRRVCQRLRS